MKITIIGSGNMGGAIARGLAKGSLLHPADITCTAKSDATLERIRAEHPEFHLTLDNEEAARGADIIVLAVKPWLVEPVIRQIKPALDYERQMIVSVAAGITFDQLGEWLAKPDDLDSPTAPALFRVMPNTAIEVMNSMTFVAAQNATNEQTQLILRLFDELGSAMLIEERLLPAGTALASCGIAYALRYIRAAIEGGVELGFYPKQAREVVARTVIGAAELLLQHESDPETEIDKVTTPGGITIKGLNEMELAGFTPAVIRGLKASR